MNACILVTGIPASGKSTLARELAKRLKMPVFSKDDIKEKLFDTVGFEGRAEKVRLGVAAMEILYDTARRMMACGQTFILENNFENASRPGLEALLKDSGYTALTICLGGDYEAIFDRFAQRDRSGKRHMGHVVNDRYPLREEHPSEISSAFTRESFAEAIKTRGMDGFTAGGPTLRVDTTDWSQVDIAAIEDWIRAQLAR